MLPKFSIDQENGEPYITFEYIFPIELKDKSTEHKTIISLNALKIKNHQCQIQYISSYLRMLRNLCKDRNKKIPKLV